MKKRIQLFTVLALIAWSQLIQAQITPAPDRKEGQGPYTQLIIRGVTLINGTGAPPFGPVDIVIEKNRIQRIITVGAEGNPIQSSRRPVLAAGGKEIDASGNEIDPRQELIDKILEYKKYKEAAVQMADLEAMRMLMMRDWATRSCTAGTSLRSRFSGSSLGMPRSRKAACNQPSRSRLRVPGIGTKSAPRWSTQASASCAGVQPFSAATRARRGSKRSTAASRIG